MTERRIIEPSEWEAFLAEFSERNRGRRARFDLFEQSGQTEEESAEGVFERAALNGHRVTVERSYEAASGRRFENDEIKDVHGITVQYDTDGSENTMEFMNHDGDMTQLHFESLVDGDS